MPQSPSPPPYRVLVCIGHEETSHAFAEAVELLRGRTPCEMHVLHVISEQLPAKSALGLTLLDQQLDTEPVKLKQRLNVLTQALGWKQLVVSHVRVGDAAPAILQMAIDVQADVIVIGTRHRSGLERAVLGSVADAVVRQAHCPVLVVTPKDYTGLTPTRRPDPPCSDCLTVRKDSRMQRYWCELHARPHLDTQVFQPTEHNPSTPPTGMRIV